MITTLLNRVGEKYSLQKNSAIRHHVKIVRQIFSQLFQLFKKDKGHCSQIFLIYKTQLLLPQTQ